MGEVSRADMPTIYSIRLLSSWKVLTPQQGINIADDADVGQAALLNLPNIVAIAFSPKNTYLTTFQRPQPGAGNAEKNLKVTFISHTQISAALVC